MRKSHVISLPEPKGTPTAQFSLMVCISLSLGAVLGDARNVSLIHSHGVTERKVAQCAAKVTIGDSQSHLWIRAVQTDQRGAQQSIPSMQIKFQHALTNHIAHAYSINHRSPLAFDVVAIAMRTVV
jgi:hypothetical protein